MRLWIKILLGMVLGVVAGLAIGAGYLDFIKPEYFKVLGDVFMKLIKMVIAPLIFFSIMTGITSLGDTKALGRIGGKAVGIYFATTLFAIVIGLLVANFIDPGSAEGFKEASRYSFTYSEHIQRLLDIIPQPLKSVNPLQIIFFASFFGIALMYVKHESKQAVIHFNEICAEVMYKIVDFVMAIAPYGVFGIMAYVIGTQGVEVMIPLMKLVLAFLIAATLHISLVYFVVLRTYVGVPFFKYLNAMRRALIVAFSTSSSSATMPTTLMCVRERLGVSKSTSDFVIPLGTTINMDGLALYQGICAIFAASYMGIDLTITQMVVVVLTVVLASVGAAGIPGTGLIMLGLVLDTIGIPMDGEGAVIVGIILGVDRILDMCRTAINVAGDSIVASVVDKSEGRFDPKVALEWDKDRK